MSGSIVFSFRLLAGLIGSRWLIRRAVRVDDQFPTVILQTVQTAGSSVRIFSHADVLVPVTVGWWRPLVLLPATWRDWTADKLEAVLLHELTHVTRRDFAVEVLAEVNRCVYWFHPAAWWLLRQLSDLAEEACDDAAIRVTGNPTGYARHLLEVAASLANDHTKLRGRRIHPGLSMARESNVESRILAILDFSRPLSRRLTWKAATMLALIAAPMIGLAAALTPAGNGSSQESTSSPDNAESPVTNASAEQLTDEEANADSTKTKEKSADKTSEFQQTKSADSERQLQVEVLDEDGQPISGAKIHASTWTEAAAYKDKGNVDYQTNDRGIADVLVYPQLTILRLWVSRPGHVTLFFHWEEGETDRIPTRYSCLLARGTELGGVVVDPEGKPVAGAKVEVQLDGGGTKVDANSNSSNNPWLAEGDDAAVTDELGRWSINNVPAGDDLDLRMSVVHPEFLCDTARRSIAKFGLTLDVLRNKSATVQLERGIPLTGHVLDPDGKPVPEAVIIWGDDPYMETGSQETRTDEQGRFIVPPHKPGPVRLTVVAKNWMPQMLVVDVQENIKPVEFRMSPGRKLHVKVVDSDGKPYPRIYLGVEQWRGAKSLYNTRHPNVLNTGIPLRADENGEYVWDWAPDDAVLFQLSFVENGESVAYTEMELTAADGLQVIELARNFKFSGTVVNAVTKDPITSYAVTPITFSSVLADARGIAQGSYREEFSEPEFSITKSPLGAQERVAFRFESPGYRVFRTERFGLRDPARTMTIELQPTDVQTGRVLDADGNPVPSASVSLSVPEDAFMIDSANDILQGRFPRLTLDEDGLFLHPTQTTRCFVVAASETGYAEKYLEAGEPAGDFVLQPWARVEGALFQDGKPVPDATIMLQPIRQQSAVAPNVQDNYQLRTDASGRFFLPRVPPIPSVISSWLSSWKDFPITSDQSIPLDLLPGETRTVQLGGDGLQIDGRVKLVGDDADTIEFRYGIHKLVRVDGGQIAVPDHAAHEPEFTAGEQRDYELRLAGPGSDLQGMEQHSVKLNPDGSMLINGVRPGHYRFLLQVYEPPTGCLVDPAGYGFLEFHTDDYAVVNNRIDLGTIEIPLRPVPKVGEKLPNFAWQDIDGQSHTLADDLGHFVLLDFWATWCLPCLEAMPEIRRLHEQSAAGSGLRVQSLSIDKDIDAAKALVRDRKLEWPQGFVGDLTASPSGQALGVSSVPLFILLDKDGTILARTSSLDSLKATLASLADE